MTDAGWTSNGPDFLEQARVLVLKMNEIQPDQWDECDEADQKHIAKALQASHQAGRAQGRVEGLREAADFVDTQELIDPSGHSSREQLKIYDVLAKASYGIRKLAQQAQEGEGRGDARRGYIARKCSSD